MVPTIYTKQPEALAFGNDNWQSINSDNIITAIDLKQNTLIM